MIRNDAGPAVNAGAITVVGSMVTGLTVGAGEDGAITLSGAHIADRLDLFSGVIRNDTGPGLVADGLTVEKAAMVGLTSSTSLVPVTAVSLEGATLVLSLSGSISSRRIVY